MVSIKVQKGALGSKIHWNKPSLSQNGYSEFKFHTDSFTNTVFDIFLISVKETTANTEVHAK